MKLEYLFAAYSIIWIAIFLYTLALGRRQRELSTDLAVVKQALATKGKRR